MNQDGEEGESNAPVYPVVFIPIDLSSIRAYCLT